MSSSITDRADPNRVKRDRPSTGSRELDERRRALGMSYPELARRCGVSEPTIKRMLGGEISRASFGHVDAVCGALGISLLFERSEQAQEFRKQQALRKARRIVALVQGTSALEAQAVDESTIESMVRRTADELLAGSPRKIWG